MSKRSAGRRKNRPRTRAGRGGAKAAYVRVWPDGPPAFYEQVRGEFRVKSPVVKYLFCDVDCAHEWRTTSPVAKAGSFTLSAERSPWEFTKGDPLCARCGKVLWHKFVEGKT